MTGAIVGAFVDLLGDRRGYLGMVVAQQQRAVTHPVVDELVAVDVPLAAAIGALDVDRKWGEVATIVGDATSDCFARTCVELRRSRESLAEGVVDRGRGRNCHTQSLPFGS